MNLIYQWILDHFEFKLDYYTFLSFLADVGTYEIMCSDFQFGYSTIQDFKAAVSGSCDALMTNLSQDYPSSQIHGRICQI